ncbi:hypothetical protein WISP_55343 [Willisornis vidua]|uniref:Uncharacterized protein n=1 Tax=Willisornis vidua TaxID=1566151 RepID=A0ABQ9DII7_9PASS|nr:hypothetical protein WISP_55343 [Willisornis vidua]
MFFYAEMVIMTSIFNNGIDWERYKRLNNQLFLTGEVLQPSNHLGILPLDPLTQDNYVTQGTQVGTVTTYKEGFEKLILQPHKSIGYNTQHEKEGTD